MEEGRITTIPKVDTIEIYVKPQHDPVTLEMVEAIVSNNFVAIEELLHRDRATTEVCAARTGAMSYHYRESGLWKKQYATFADFCLPETGRAYSTVSDLMSNYEYYVLKSGYDPGRYVGLSARLGWTVLREIRLKKLLPDQLDKLVEKIEKDKATRDNIKELCEQIRPGVEEEDPLTDAIDSEPWPTLKIKLPPDQHKKVMDMLTDIQERIGKDDPGLALVRLVPLYWMYAEKLEV